MSRDTQQRLARTRLGTLLCASLTLGLGACTMGVPTTRNAATIVHEGATMEGWFVAVGDGIHTAGDEPPVTESDIRTTHGPNHTTLEANVEGRGVMAHNITYLWDWSEDVTTARQSFTFDVRLPYLPRPYRYEEFSAQSVEAQLGAWNGSDGFDTVCAVQWLLNPFVVDEFETLAVWVPDGRNGARWDIVGTRDVDTAWQRWHFEYDAERATCRYDVDGQRFAAPAGSSGKEGWTTDSGVHVGVEIVSLFPSDATWGRRHYAEFRDWTWRIERMAGSP